MPKSLRLGGTDAWRRVSHAEKEDLSDKYHDGTITNEEGDSLFLSGGPEQCAEEAAMREVEEL